LRRGFERRSQSAFSAPIRRSQRCDRILPPLDEMVGEGMVTLERVEVIAYRGSQSAS